MKIENFFLTSKIKDLNLKEKRVLLRADLNVPISNKKIINDYKLETILPTIDLIQKHGAKVILITHIGRPKDKEPELSTKIIADWFEKKGYSITLEPDLDKAKEKSFENGNSILMLENLRFFPEKKDYADSLRVQFAKKLASLGDYFVQDAFGTLHRNDTSITILPKLFEKDTRFIGPFMEKELKIFDTIRAHLAKPFVFIIGGGKIKSKLPLIENILDKVQTILLCPAIVFTFSKYLKKPVGKSLVDDSLIPIVPKILQKARDMGVKILFPQDYQIAKGNFEGPVSYIDSDKIPHDSLGMSIGKKTQELFEKEIMKAKTVFFNGAFGNMNKKETLYGMKALLEAMAQSKAFTVVAGGDSIAAACNFGLADSIDYLSTAGGATLAYLSGIELPGLKAFGS